MRTVSCQDRARIYLAKMEPAISGKNGHDACFNAALAAVKKFELSQEEAFALLKAEYNPRCVPQWSDRELRHKVKSAYTQGRAASLVDQETTSPWQARGAGRGWTSSPPSPTPDSAPKRPTQSELDALWARCLPVDVTRANVPEAFIDVALFLGNWALWPPRTIAEHDLCRILPSKGDLPAWCSHWPAAGSHLVVPAIGEQRRSCLVACNVLTGKLEGPPALVACPATRRWLTAGEPPPAALVCACVGEWLHMATVATREPEPPAVLCAPRGTGELVVNLTWGNLPVAITGKARRLLPYLPPNTRILKE